MANEKELSFWEKAQMVEDGSMSVEEAAKDPNPTMAFTSFVGNDPGAKPGDADYTTKNTTKTPRKRKNEDSAASPAKRGKKEEVAASDGEASTTKETSGRNVTHGVPWYGDEEEFAFEKIAEYPNIGPTELTRLLNEEFVDRPYTDPVTKKVWQRGARSVDSVGQHFKPEVKKGFIALLDEATDKDAPSMGWAQPAAAAEDDHDE